ncbi:MAG: HEAT repeat domain-containing protein [Acidobacteria bacterium]|nr:HEAT repeat domain-containing protein [Acidobacteriota bacterium]
MDPDWVEEARPDLFELTLRAPLVVHGRTLDGRRKYPVVAVIEVLQGEFSGKTLRVAFRHLNRSRDPKEPPIQFLEGREILLFLAPGGEGKPGDRFQLVRRRHGKVDLPGEGSAGILEAVRIFARVVETDPAEHFSRIRDLLESPNPIVASTVLRQFRKHGLAGPEDLPGILRILRLGREEERLLAARILESFLAGTRGEGREMERESDVLDLLVAAARNDPSPAVRAASVSALRESGSPVAVETLVWIARTDASQMVRFQAEIALLHLRRQGEGTRP